MSNFIIINNFTELSTYDKWKDSDKFNNSTENIVDDKGKKLPANYTGNRYELICIKERNYTSLERSKNGLSGIFIAIRSIVTATFSQSVRKSIWKRFTKKHTTVRFGKPIPSPIKNASFSISPTLPTDTDYTKYLPKEILNEVLSYLDDPKDLARCLRVNKQWNKVANQDGLWEAFFPKEAFGKKEWATYFGDIGKEPPLPREVYGILNSPCPVYSEKKVAETHTLILIPKTVDGEELTFNKWKVLIKSPISGNATDFRYDAPIAQEYGDKSPPETHWVLVLNDVIPGSRNKRYADQTTLVANLAKLAKADYKVPNMLDVMACIFMKYVSSKVRLLSNDPRTYTRCQEGVFGTFQVVVGCFAPSGFSVSSLRYGHGETGVAALRKF